MASKDRNIGAGSISNISRLQKKLAVKKGELTQNAEELRKLSARQRQLEKEVKSLKEELDFLMGSDSSISQFDRDDFPWSTDMTLKLNSVFNIKSFRSHQKSAINATMNKLDCILIMPTGGGKSLCFQLPAILSSGVTLVISPLLALMEDQLQNLRSLNVSAELLNAQTGKIETKCIFESMINPKATLKLLYVTPERLAKSKRFMSQLEKMYKLGRLTRLVIDECHCCSSWGHDFRPDYKYLGIMRRQFPGTPIIGLTATATTKVTLDVQKMLNIEGCLVFKDSFFRPNLKYEVFHVSETKERVESVSNLIKSRFSRQSGIIYCLTVVEVENVTAKLKSLDIRCERYHAQLEPHDRTRIQHDWYTNKISIIIATVAFGMGINKLDVRFVIHYTISKSLENFYQESGRAGRDGEPGYCILLYQLSDVFRATSMMMSEKNGIQNVYNMLEYCLDRETCRKACIARHFGDPWEKDACEGSCDTCEAKRDSSSIPMKTLNVAPLLKDILKILHHGEKIEQRVTILKLMSAWFRKGEKKLRLDDVSVPHYSKTICESVVGRLLMDQYIAEEFHFTPYATISHLVPGPRKHSDGTALNYTLPASPVVLSMDKNKLPHLPVKVKKSSAAPSATKPLEKWKSDESAKTDTPFDDQFSFIDSQIQKNQRPNSRHDASFTSTSSKDSTTEFQNSKNFVFKKKTTDPPRKKQKLAMNFTDTGNDDDDVVVIN